MNNTAITTLTIAAILAATQVVGVTLAMTTTTANAIGSKKRGQDEGSKNNGSLHLHKSKNYYVL
jgi:hypothetical protein